MSEETDPFVQHVVFKTFQPCVCTMAKDNK